MPFLILSILLQACLVIHIIRTGRSTTWIWVVVMLPLAGAIAYSFLEVLPDIADSRSGKHAGRKIQSIINPNKAINETARNYTVSDTVQNSMQLAEECLNKNMYTEAKELYKKCLNGVNSTDPDLMFGLAKCDFEAGKFADVRETLDKLIENNPDYKNQNAHLLYARSLENIGDNTSAQHEYETLHKYFSGPEASYFFAMFLKSQNQGKHAKTLFSEIVEKSKMSGRHYNNLYKEIISSAKRELYS